jgi:hypothetical protein
MSEPVETTPDADGVSQANPFELSAELGKAAATAFAQASEAMDGCSADWRNEAREFIASRMKADAEFPAALANCRNPVEIAKVQQDWLIATAGDYARESGRLAEMGAASLQHGLSNWLTAFKEAEGMGTWV